MQKLHAEGYVRILLASERSEPPQAGVSFARVARLKIQPFFFFPFKSTFSALSRPHPKAPLRGGSLRSARYARLATLAYLLAHATSAARVLVGWRSRCVACSRLAPIHPWDPRGARGRRCALAERGLALANTFELGVPRRRHRPGVRLESDSASATQHWRHVRWFARVAGRHLALSRLSRRLARPLPS